jgi:hypothetical protein
VFDVPSLFALILYLFAFYPKSGISSVSVCNRVDVDWLASLYKDIFLAYADVLSEEDLRVLHLAPTTPALTVGNPVRVRLQGRSPPNSQPRSSRPHPRSQAQWYLVVANRHPKPKEAASIPALTSTSTTNDRISSSPTQSRFTPVAAQLPHAANALLQCMQPRLLEPAPTSHYIVSRHSSPHAAQPYDCRAIPMRFPTTHTVFEEVHPPRAAAR